MHHQDCHQFAFTSTGEVYLHTKIAGDKGQQLGLGLTVAPPAQVGQRTLDEAEAEEGKPRWRG